MTGADFSEVDIDLLADYVGGALDGTPDEAVVAALVADDPAWRAAHQELTGGTAAVTAGLRALAAEPMPADIAVRLTAALADLPPRTRTGAPEPDLSSADPDIDPRPAGVPTAAPSGPGSGSGSGSGQRRVTAVGEPRRGRRSKRTGASAPRRWVGPVAVAAGAIVVVGIGFGTLLTNAGDLASDTTSTAGGAPAARENAPMLDSSESGTRPGSGSATGLDALPAEAQISASGLDYRPDSLGDRAARAADSTSAEKRAPASARSRVFADQTPVGLQRLNDRTALAACLEAIAQENGDGAVTVNTVDYARYLGDPALVVNFTAGNGTWTWASGPDCGKPDAAAATLNRVKVG